jgi:hypothetical protein
MKFVEQLRDYESDDKRRQLTLKDVTYRDRVQKIEHQHSPVSRANIKQECREASASALV